MADEQLDRPFLKKISTDRIHSLVEIVPDWSEFHCVFRTYLIGINKICWIFLVSLNQVNVSLTNMTNVILKRNFLPNPMRRDIVGVRGDEGLIKQAQQSLEKSFVVAVSKGLQLESSYLVYLCSHFTHRRRHLPTLAVILGAEMLSSSRLQKQTSIFTHPPAVCSL